MHSFTVLKIISEYYRYSLVRSSPNVTVPTLGFSVGILFNLISFFLQDHMYWFDSIIDEEQSSSSISDRLTSYAVETTAQTLFSLYFMYWFVGIVHTSMKAAA